MENKEITQTLDALIKDATVLKKNVNKLALDAREHAEARVNFVRAQAGDRIERLVTFVRDYPVYVAVGALAIGLLIGLTRRRRS